MGKTGIGDRERITLRFVETIRGDPWSPTVQRHVVQKLDEHWEAWIALERLPGRSELDPVGLEIRSRDKDGVNTPLRSATFTRGIRLDAATKYGRLIAQQPPPQSPIEPGRRPERSKRPGRRGHSLAYLAQIASEYVEAVEEGMRMIDLATVLDLSEKALRETLRKARRRGVLTQAPNGSAGGQLTELGRALQRPRTADHRVLDPHDEVIEAGKRGFERLRWDSGLGRAHEKPSEPA